MDPVVEQLHSDHQQRRTDSPAPRELVAESLAGILLLAACAVLSLLSPPHGAVISGEAIGLVALYVVVGRVNFEVGIGVTTPLELVFVPMWFVVEPAHLPLLVLAGELLATGLRTLSGRDRRHPSRVLVAMPDAWYAVGPAVVLAAFGVVSPSLADWPIYLLALLAQFLVDGLVGVARGWAVSGVQPRLQLRPLLWIGAVDLALAPLGVGAAILMESSPWAILGILPIVGLLAQFSKERDASIEQAHDLSTAYRGTAQLMGDVLEADDEYTGGEHTQGVVGLSLMIGRELGLDATELRDLEFGALLHDIGKLRVPKEIINKPGKLNDEEWAIIKMHPEWGQEMLARIGGVLAHAGTIVRAHHERFDGQGYPDRSAGDEIPLAARIITVCDSFSAMTTDRSYRKAMTLDQAVAELRRCTGTQFDPGVVAALDAVLTRGEYGPGADTIALTVSIVGEDVRSAAAVAEPVRSAA